MCDECTSDTIFDALYVRFDHEKLNKHFKCNLFIIWRDQISLQDLFDLFLRCLHDPFGSTKFWLCKLSMDGNQNFEGRKSISCD